MKLARNKQTKKAHLEKSTWLENEHRVNCQCQVTAQL